MKKDKGKFLDKVEILKEELRLANEKAAASVALYNFAPIGYFTLYHDGTILELNPKGAQLLGDDYSNLINKKFEHFVIQDNRKDFSGFLKRVSETNDKQCCKLWLSVKGDISSHVLIEGIPHGNGQKCLMAMVDLTEHKKTKQALRKSEAEYKRIIEQITDMYYRADVEGKLVMANPSCLETFGYSSMEEILGHPLEILYQNPNERSEFVAILKKKGRVKNYRTTLLRKDGASIYVETTANIILDSNGNYAGVEGIVRDITDRKRAEENLLQLNHQLKELIATKDKLLSIIAHDLRSPFNGILGFSELVYKTLRKCKIEQSEEYIKLINSTARNTLNLLDNLLAWSRIQTGIFEFKPQKLVLQEVIQEVIEILKTNAKIKNISIRYFQSEEIIIYADPNMLQTILRNMVSNSIKFTNTGGHIEIHANHNPKHVEIIVKDNGVGMSQETMANLFKIDGNPSTPGTANERGSGIGLILCKEFVEKQGGKIMVKSELGKGSEFKFTLPLCKI